uniref:Poly [ADP-ribose] polymerase n=1 Tax=Culex tarsalis TaxID=7177 RepID=A0A1Q3F8K5_CULTA
MDRTAKCSALRATIDRDPVAADLRVSLVVAAAKSFKYDSCLQPFPPDYIVNKEKKIDELNRVLDSLPALSEIVPPELDDSQLDLLCWILCKQHGPGLRTVAKSDFESVFAKAPCLAAFQRPQFVFEVVHREDANSERRFRANRTDFRTHHAYHGSKLFSFYSILNYGLQQHLNKTAVFGEGIYLSEELHVSQMFAPTGSGWSASTLGSHLSCTAICEYVDNPAFVRWQEDSQSSSIPERYVLVKNNEMVQLRYLLVYGNSRGNGTTSGGSGTEQVKQPQAKQQQRVVVAPPPNRCVRWMAANKSWLLAGGYVAMLFAIGLMNSRNAHYMKQMFLNKINGMCNALFGSEET